MDTNKLHCSGKQLLSQNECGICLCKSGFSRAGVRCVVMVPAFLGIGTVGRVQLTVAIFTLLFSAEVGV